MKPSVKYLGRVAIVRVPRGSNIDLVEFAKDIMKRNNGVETVLEIERVEGAYRVPVVRHVAGSLDTVTTVKEDGVIYTFDASRLMFSLGNFEERRRVRKLPRPGEIVVDMFAGVGQFTLPAAKSEASHVYSFEINEEAYAFLVKNIRLNRVEHKVTAFNADCRKSVDMGLKGCADRVLMGYFKGTVEYFPTALQLLKNMGGYIHFHEIAENESGWATLYKTVSELAERLGYFVELVNKRVVKTYSPKLSHWVLDLFARRKL
ncbi:MAG: class I SAM-dependent methyltransferase family protein [Candidatus Caldarchaeum sp.]|uniref:Class I SAM-dependent methyltransferase family protein n=2 Tax=Caldiarchaeum subterraneum TaxID=311458 RepID=A0A7C4E1A5_CALS0